MDIASDIATAKDVGREEGMQTKAFDIARSMMSDGESL
jgi:hypothetical protein